MTWIDWLLVLIPILIVVFIGFKAQRYVKGVSDFLTGGRVAGRYVLTVSQGEVSLGLISLVAMYEIYYQSGFAYSFWAGITGPIGMIMALTGYAVYRYRETRAMTMGQFLEMRYSRRFRVFSAILQSVSGIVNYGVFPAVGARFLVYFCDLPLEVEIGGWCFPTFALVMAAFLSVALLVATIGGQITIMVTDCIQGLLSYPIYLIVAVYVIYRFSWFDEMAPALLDRPPGQSMLNPFDTSGLRDFNIVYVVIGVIGSILNRMSWLGQQSYSAAALNAHEQKIGALLGSWRSGFQSMMLVLLAIAAYTFLNHASFKSGDKGATNCRNDLAVKVMGDVAGTEEFADVRAEFEQYVATGEFSPEMQQQIDEIKAQEAAEKAERATETEETAAANEQAEPEEDPEPMVTAGRYALKTVSKKKAQEFGTIFGQMRVPLAWRYILPVGIMGAFCALCIFLLISTDTTYLHSWGTILVQDLILPIRGRPFTPRQQMRLVRCLMAGVAIYAFFFSYFFGQVDYIQMFLTITGAIWVGGAGPCIIGGLYWKRGTSAGAWVCLVVGSSLSVATILTQQYWVEHIYPWLSRHGYLETARTILEGASAPFEPFIQWRVTPDKFPINSQEMIGIMMFTGLGLYILVSLLTCRKPFNMERMLHRGKYHREGIKIEREPVTFRNIFVKLIGITDEYSRGDRILAWSIFIYSFFWGFLLTFSGVVIWNFISPWSNQGWANWFFFQQFILSAIIAVISTVWFSIGTTIDLRRLFRRLREKQTNVLDDGRVIGHVSADDVALVEQVENISIEEAHREETMLRDAMETERDDEDKRNLSPDKKQPDTQDPEN